jgi:hypothetical protein
LGLHRTIFGWIAEVPEGVKLKNLKGMIAQLDVLRRIGPYLKATEIT